MTKSNVCNILLRPSNLYNLINLYIIYVRLFVHLGTIRKCQNSPKTENIID